MNIKGMLVAMLTGAALATEPIDTDLLFLGQGLYIDQCQRCHAADGSGPSTVDIRGFEVDDIKMALQGFEQMPVFDMNEKEIAALSVYLNVLEGTRQR
ncbi:c-type cytochrome [Reinekea blandensis]|uniref:Cytochrome c domain-containing protein n=1 Tax=Reinekea blandensis MED297 TaxID=314283 RepID=A4BFL7_9GAMM|nr:cytochrome c [Reinekea blandensis]EAR09112.1 hypothetical protein MED297_17258 [Reinekea sp. MED297] [Reinekea blandensis MED297]